MSETNNIEILWDEVRAGSSSAWTSLVLQLSPIVYTVGRRWGLEVADAEDVSQQTWLALYDSRHKILDPVALPAWLMRVAARKAQRIHDKRLRDNTLPAHHDPAEPALPEDELLALERLALLHIALTHLDERCRRLVHELFLTEPRKSYEQIARDFGLKANSLGPIRIRCLIRLRRILQEMGL
ncbi:MAG: sigma-70 family RNA polymerase sigma factor [candidate division Zixibacteria bacterium]|nr:sigma-70 family RNA polymerase sigma factor [candidate division Zixibacteria bacterium]